MGDAGGLCADGVIEDVRVGVGDCGTACGVEPEAVVPHIQIGVVGASGGVVWVWVDMLLRRSMDGVSTVPSAI